MTIVIPTRPDFKWYEWPTFESSPHDQFMDQSRPPTKKRKKKKRKKRINKKSLDELTQEFRLTCFCVDGYVCSKCSSHDNCPPPSIEESPSQMIEDSNRHLEALRRIIDDK